MSLPSLRNNQPEQHIHIPFVYSQQPSVPEAILAAKREFMDDIIPKNSRTNPKTLYRRSETPIQHLVERTGVRGGEHHAHGFHKYEPLSKRTGIQNRPDVAFGYDPTTPVKRD